jgi:hypothetical protein
MNKHALIELLIRICGLIAFAVAPYLIAMAYRGWMNTRGNLPRWRSFLGTSSIYLTLINWIGFAYMLLDIATNGRIGPFELLLVFNVVGFFASIAALALSLALKGRPKAWASFAAALVTALWTTSNWVGR